MAQSKSWIFPWKWWCSMVMYQFTRRYLARFAQFANIPHHKTRCWGWPQLLASRDFQSMLQTPGPRPQVRWVRCCIGLGCILIPFTISSCITRMRSLLSTHPLNLDEALVKRICPQKNRPRVNFWGQSLVDKLHWPTESTDPGGLFSLLRPAKAQACCRHLPTWPGSVRANARPATCRDAWLLQGSGLDHKEVLELLEEGEGCIDLDMAGKIRSNLRVLGDMSIVMLNARGYQLFFLIFRGKPMINHWSSISTPDLWRLEQPDSCCSLGPNITPIRLAPIPSSARHQQRLQHCAAVEFGQRQCLVSLHVLDNFKAPFKPWCNCWSPGSEETPILDRPAFLDPGLALSLPCAHPGS